MLSRIPDQSIILEPGVGSEHKRACRGDGYVIVYLPQGGSVKVKLASLRGQTIHAWWYDPRTGEARDAGLLTKSESMNFVAPWAGPCSDWVLVLDDAGANFAAPGNNHLGGSSA